MKAVAGKARGRILLVIDDMGVGGAQKQVAALAGRLAAVGFEAGVVCTDRGGVNLEMLPSGVPVEILGARRVFDADAACAVLKLVRLIRAGRYHIVEAYLPAAHFLSAPACAASGAQLVAARRNLAELDPAWYAAVAPVINRLTACSIANSQAVKRSVVARYGLRAAKIAVVPNMVEPVRRSFSRTMARGELGVPDNAFVAVAAGSLTRVKNYPAIVRAFAALASAEPRAVLLVAGDGPERRSVSALAQRLGLNGELRMLGATRETGRVFAAADVFVHASKSEGSSNALLEAMAAGLPAVVSDIPANREALGDAGHYFDPGDWRGCLEGLLAYMASSALRRHAGACARRLVEKRFDPAAALARRVRIYAKLSEASRWL